MFRKKNFKLFSRMFTRFIKLGLDLDKIGFVLIWVEFDLNRIGFRLSGIRFSGKHQEKLKKHSIKLPKVVQKYFLSSL